MSMSQRDRRDNAMMESFFGSLKTEWIATAMPRSPGANGAIQVHRDVL
jgi:transposase InsO family protein